VGADDEERECPELEHLAHEPLCRQPDDEPERRLNRERRPELPERGQKEDAHGDAEQIEHPQARIAPGALAHGRSIVWRVFEFEANRRFNTLSTSALRALKHDAFDVANA